MRVISRFAASGGILALVLCAGVFSGNSARAQGAVPPAKMQPALPPVAAQAPVPALSAADRAPQEFTLGADDVIEVTVRDHAELDHTLTILPDGKIAYPTIGEMQAAGKTPRALAGEIKAELETTLNNIRVTVTVKEIHSRRVRIMGAVKSPGGFDLKRDWHLFDLVMAAGGLSGKPDQTTARIIRNGALVPVNVAEAMRAPQSSANILLERDDLALLDEQAVVKRQVQVVGQVARPSLYDIEPDATLMQVLALAGNPTDRAALSRAYVLREGTQIPVNLYTFLVEGKADDSVTKFRMQAGDTVYIPQQEARFSVQGQVGKPGFYPYPEKGQVTVLDALNEAGGGSGGDLSKAAIIRMTDGKYAATPINIDQMLKKGDLAKNTVLQPGDMLYVPTRAARKGLGFQDVLAPLSLLGILGIHF